ncbi:MAG: hypothetical protein IJA30_03570 [Bacilli bacterium]|nr:hypothetical protein [Bacilli bacterium]
MNKKVKYILLFFTVLFVILIGIFIGNNKYVDTVKYKGNTYVLLEYNSDIFTYYHNSNKFYEEDIIHPVSHNKWNVVYFNDDLFVLDKEVKVAKKYYGNDNNYNWFIVFNGDDSDVKKSISLTKNELKNLYNIESSKKKIDITFDEINKFGDLLKVSKDGLVQGIVTLAQVDGNWYYKTEVMTDDDKEIVIELEKTLNDKINAMLK